MKFRAVLGAFVLLTAGVAANLSMQQHTGGGTASARLALDRNAKPGGDRNKSQVATASGEPAPIALHATMAEAQPVARSKADTSKQTRTPPLPTGATASAEPPPAGASEITAATQRELQARGYEPGTPDGVPGLVTRAAIMAFEHDHGLALTAEPTEALLRALQAGPGAISASAYAAAAKDKRQRVDLVIRTVQQSLTGLGYAAGKASGRIGEETERAIREFEIDQGLRVTGRISGPLVAKLARAAGNGKLASGR